MVVTLTVPDFWFLLVWQVGFTMCMVSELALELGSMDILPAGKFLAF